jgi:hypothetical protein
VRWCPECGHSYEDAYAACPHCRVVLVNEPPPPPGGGEPVVIHRVPDAAAGALLCGILEFNGVRAVLRGTSVPGYGVVARDWSTSHWGEILVPRDEAAEARAIIADYVAELERGGAVRDEDVEESAAEGDGPERER